VPDLDGEEVLGPIAELDRAASEHAVHLVLVALEGDRGGPAHPPACRPEEGGPQELGVGVAPLDLAVSRQRSLAGLGMHPDVEVSTDPRREPVVELIE